MKTVKNWIIVVVVFVIAMGFAVEVAAIRDVKSIIENDVSEIATTISNTTYFRDSSERFEKQSDLLEKAIQLLEKQINLQEGRNEQRDTAEMLKTVLTKLEALQIQIAMETESHSSISEQNQIYLNEIESLLTDISSEIAKIDNLYPSTQRTSTYVTNYYLSADTEESDEEERGEEESDEEPLHTHEFDVYGNCIDETCAVHEEVEVFDLIDLRRSIANENYYYRLMWEGDLKLEIVYAYSSPDDVEITLFSDEAHTNAIPMERYESSYTAELLEAGMYYIQVHTLTDGDIEISIY